MGVGDRATQPQGKQTQLLFSFVSLLSFSYEIKKASHCDHQAACVCLCPPYNVSTKRMNFVKYDMKVMTFAVGSNKVFRFR
jgi:hypothetical protein